MTPFTFAGFQFPRHIVEIKPEAQPGKRVQAVHYHAPKPLEGGAHPGQGFYMEDTPGLRWKWADDVDGAGIRHTGWPSDEDQADELIRGIVFRLPHGRGFLAGCSMGEGMISEVDGHVWAEECDAARDADRMAERTAEAEREYQAKERERIDAEEAEEEARRADVRKCFC